MPRGPLALTTIIGVVVALALLTLASMLSAAAGLATPPGSNGRIAPARPYPSWFRDSNESRSSDGPGRRSFRKLAGRMRSKALATVAVCAALLGVTIVAASASANGRPEVICPEGFNLGALTLEERLQLPKVHAGLEAGVYTVEDIIAVTEFLDRNDNGLLCIQDITQRTENAAEASGWAYLANAVDDNAAARP
jgi:hypothetical protein